MWLLILFLEIWHHYDDEPICPKPKEKQANRKDPSKGRKIAARAMLPCWEGFSKDHSSSEKMKAWEAIEQVQDVANCLHKSHHFKEVKGDWIIVESSFNLLS